MDVAQKGKEKEIHVESKTPLHQAIEEESEYNPTPHTFTTAPITLPPLIVVSYPIVVSKQKCRHPFMASLKPPSRDNGRPSP